MQTKRDISIIDLSPGEFLVIACDSLGGIGSKKEDKINVNNRVVGRLTTQVALMEVLARGRGKDAGKSLFS
ncbi:hypothetical protein [Halanaerobacter jeridensis]|uniref:Uncharacterized protein n=1 Tax=Halanaerobacter jeridensis TaxID=706427 RepID=A0A938XSY2_9FIRM|nr:hypothetical protein [Halanaerobacter jeridensis]MBM7557146.1 hypothetical protein [Halanaerobacter jeridensis]